MAYFIHVYVNISVFLLICVLAIHMIIDVCVVIMQLLTCSMILIYCVCSLSIPVIDAMNNIN